MNPNVLIALMSLIGTAIGTVSGILVSNSLTRYRISQLESKVDKHNCLIERVYILEGDMKTVKVELADMR